MTPTSSYSLATKIVDEAIRDKLGGNDATRAGYLLARAALLHVSMTAGNKRAAKMARALSIELTAGIPE